MANLLADANLWHIDFDAPPPSSWNGSAYAINVSSSSTASFQLLYNGGSQPVAGDVIAGSITYTDAGGLPPGNTAMIVLYDPLNGEVLASQPITYGVESAFSFDASAYPADAWLDTGLDGVRLLLEVSNAPATGFPAYLYGLQLSVTPLSVPTPVVSYNCDCDDDYPRTTLLDMRKRVMRRLGFSVQAANPPPGMADLIDDFIRSAQELLFRRYSVFRRERFYTWDLVPGTRFYDLDANADECTKRLDPRMVSWVGISQGDGNWRPLVCGIDPVMYTSRGPGIPSHYEIRQCIELWPAPNDATWKLRAKGQFGLAPLQVNTDVTTVEPEAIFMLAVANAKAHYGQPDAGNYASQLTAYVRDLVRGSHHTRRYLPGRNDVRNAVRPIPVGGWPEDT